MDLSAINPVLLIASLMVAATPLLLAAIGELVVEKAGVLNLGVEGMMIVGAIAGFATAVESGSPLLGFVAAAFAGAALSILFAILTQFAQANQVASGLSLTLFGLGLSALDATVATRFRTLPRNVRVTQKTPWSRDLPGKGARRAPTASRALSETSLRRRISPTQPLHYPSQKSRRRRRGRTGRWG